MASSEVCLILYHDSSIGIDEAAAAMPRNLTVERRGDVLHVRWTADSEHEIRIRAVSGVSARDGRVRWHRTLPEEVALFPRAFEISFDDLDAALDDINVLIDVQCTLEDLTAGACYNTWNRNLTMPGERGA
jgi:hypothetical protein